MSTSHPMAFLRVLSCLSLLLCCYSAASAQVSYYELVAWHSGKCLDVNSASTAAGAQVWQWDCNGTHAQQWQFIEVGDGYKKVVARHSGKVLDVANAGLGNGDMVWQWDDNGMPAQQWQFTGTDDGYYRVTARHSGKALEVSGGSTASGTQVVQWDFTGGANQRWLIRPVTWGSDPRGRTGEWSPPMSWPFIAVHAHLLPNGKVLAWAGENSPDPEHYTQVYLWNPGDGTFRRADNTTTDLFCSGHSFLPDGRLLVTGGHHHLEEQQPVGEPHASLFDYRLNRWTRAPDMGAGRWYPTNTTLANGEVLVASGAIVGDQSVNETPEVWQTTGTWRALTGAARRQPLYPWMHVAPNGTVFNSGPGPNTDYMNTSGAGFWSVLTNSLYGLERGAGSSVTYAPGKVMIAGGGDPPTNTAEVIDLSEGWPAWRFANPMVNARRHLNSTLLPDGMVLVTGGTSVGGFNEESGAVHTPELWDPVTGWWATLAPMRVPRVYHSTALLLPDGRVLSAGGGNVPGGIDHPDAEVYSPPYLFKGPRPTIRSAPTSVGYGQRFLIWTSQAASVARVTLVRLSSVTHSYNQNQRFNDLSATIERISSGVYVRAPANRNECPPGHYMLFIIDGAGVPSAARIIQIQ